MNATLHYNHTSVGNEKKGRKTEKFFIMSKTIRRANNVYLSEEIISDILLRVAVKDVSRYKSVCKLWNSLISDPRFAKAHSQRQQRQQPDEEIIFRSVQNPKLRTKEFKYDYFSINKDMKPKKLRLCFHNHDAEDQKIVLSLQSSCNGLLLLQDKHSPNQLYVSNPVTCHCEALPPAPEMCTDWALVHDTCTSIYKVFGVSTQQICYAFTKRDQTSSSIWRKLVNPTSTQNVRGILSLLTLVDKELHWLHSDVDHNNQNSVYLFSLNVEAEEFRRIKVPQCQAKLLNNPADIVRVHKALHLLLDVKGSLGITIVSHDHLDICVLQDRVNSIWTKYHRISLQSLSNKPFSLTSFLSQDISLFSMRCSTGRGELFTDLVKVIVHDEDKLIFYDLKTQNPRLIARLSKDQRLCRPYVHYSKSLANWS